MLWSLSKNHGWRMLVFLHMATRLSLALSMLKSRWVKEFEDVGLRGSEKVERLGRIFVG
jgi:hypothetical protein